MLNWMIVILGAIVAVIIESIYRAHKGSFDQVAMLTLPLAIFTTYGVFKTMQLGRDIISAILIWTLVTTIMRVVSALFILDEKPGPGAWVGLVLVIFANLASKFWR